MNRKNMPFSQDYGCNVQQWIDRFLVSTLRLQVVSPRSCESI